MNGPARLCLSVCLLATTGLAIGGALVLAAAEARAAGVIVPEAAQGKGHVELASVEVLGHVRGRAAEVTVVHAFRANTKEPIAASFHFALPPGRVQAPPTVRLGGRTLEGELLRGEAARKAWSIALHTLRDPTLIRHVGSDLYRVKLPMLAPTARIDLAVTYEQRLPADAGLSSFVCPVRPAPRFTLDLKLETAAPLGPIYSPTHAIDVERSGAQHARVRYAGEATLQTPCLGLYWSTTRSRIGATLLTYWPEDEAEGYYLVLAAPTVGTNRAAARRAQSITFVVDISGSMRGARLEGMRAALRSAIRELGPLDHFNVIAYHSEVAPLWPEPRPASQAARDEALGFVDGLRARGRTNIEGALRRALMAPRPAQKPSVVLFLTDGRPTEGEIDPEKILASIRNVNEKARTRIYVLGIGVDTHTVMLDRLALENGGAPAFVPPRESVEQHLEHLYARIRHPVLTDITFAARGMELRETIASKLPDLFEGGALILAGRYSGGGPTELILSGRDGTLEREYHYARSAARRGGGVADDFPARVWATRRVAALVDAVRLHDSRTPELLLELVRLSTQFGVLTEYTAFLAEETCTSCSAGEDANAKRARKYIDALAPKVVGAAGLAQAKGQAERRAAQRSESSVGTWVATPDGRDVERIEARGIRMLGNRTFYFRGPEHGWVAAGLDPTKAPDATITRWSPAFFALLGTTTPVENKRLAQPGRLLLRVQGRILRIVDPA